jgi:hypothetical protein
MKKQTFILVPAILLLLGLVGWMIFDLFPGKQENAKNSFDYGMDALRRPDSIPSYTEILPIRPTLKEIRGIATDPSGKIFVAGINGVEIFTPTGRKNGFFSIGGTPYCISWMHPGQLLIGMETHTETRTLDGKLVNKWPLPDPASVITSLAATPEWIYLADAGKKVVWKYDHQGKIQGRIGEKDPERKIPGFVIPSPFFDLGISPTGQLWVVNPGRHQFEQYQPDGMLVSAWGEAGLTPEGFTGCCNPSHFAFLPDGSFVTSEKGLERIKIYSPDGKYQRLVASPESFDEGTKGLDLAVGMEGRILVLDPVRNQIRVFLPNETQ